MGGVPPRVSKVVYESPHSSLGFLTPFEVYFGHHPDRLKNKLFLGEKNEFEVQEENYQFNRKVDEIAKQEELCELADERFVIRQKALEASSNAAKKMVKRELKRQPPSLHYKGETILVRIPTSKKTVKGNKSSLKSSCEGRVIDIDHTAHKYQIEFKDPDTLKYKTAWFKVDDVTSLTKEEENKRQRIAQEQSNCKRKTFAGGPDHEKVVSKVKRTEAKLQNPSLLDTSID